MGGNVEYEIVNPSDEVYISSDSKEAACAATLILGGGQYGLEEKAGAKVMPIFLFGGHDEWWKETFGRSFKEYLNDNTGAIAEAMESVKYARERTSMNNIGARAEHWAKTLREKVVQK